MYEGIAQISPIFVRVARTLGASDGEIFRKVIVPLAARIYAGGALFTQGQIKLRTALAQADG